MRILAFDIETRACLVQFETYDVYGDFRIGPGDVVRPVEMVSFAASWVGSPDVEFWSKYDGSRRKMVKRAWRLLDEADVVLHYNGERFDVPHLMREFAERGLGPPLLFKQIDLYKTARRVFRFPMNKLAYVAPALGLEEKVEHEGIMSLIRRCERREPDALGILREYNVRDVELLEALYMRLQPWILNHPNRGAWASGMVCRVCGSERLESRGTNVTRAGLVYPRFCCKACGAWSQGKTALQGSPQIKAVG